MKFMRYEQNQIFLLPPSLVDCLPEDHLSFVISDVVDHLDLSAIEGEYQEAGHPAYHPKMLVKVLFYGYTQGVRSSRKLESKTQEDIAFRYLTGSTHLDHGTINLFRKNHLTELPLVFAQIIAAAQGLGLANFSDVSLDGTKIKAQASRENLFTKEQIGKLKAKAESFLRDAEQLDAEETAQWGSKRGYNQIPKHLVDPAARAAEIRRIQKRLTDLNEAEKEIDRKQEEAKQRDATKVKGRQAKRKQNNTNSTTTNTTDPEAGFMKMKEGSYKMAYNVQITAANQYIAAYDVSNESNDTKTLPEMVRKTEENTGRKVETVKADAAYFTKYNMAFVRDNQTEAFIPDRLKETDEHAQRTEGEGKPINKYDRKNFTYDEETNRFICPEGKPLTMRQKDIFGDGIREYRGTECATCPFLSLCARGKARHIQVDFALDRMVSEMRAKLNTEAGRKKYGERLIEVEPVMADLKRNQGFSEFLCRGKDMALVELGLVSSAHNLKKIFLALKRRGTNRDEVNWEKVMNLKTA